MNKSRTRNIIKHRELLLMLLPGIVYLLINNYLPMMGVFIAFKDVNFAKGLLGSDWIGFKNFYYLFNTSDAWLITRNTVLYNISFIGLDIIIPVSFAILINELTGKWAPKLYQTIMLFPYFISMVVVSYLVLALLHHENGYINSTVMPLLGGEGKNWYDLPRYWPFFLPVIHVWKSTGYSSIVYLAVLTGIDKQYYEALAIDGGGKWKQIRYISLPMLQPVVIILSVMAVGRIFRSDFGLFYQVPLQSGTLFSVTNVIDTYVYRALINLNDLGMASAAGLYQAVVGFGLVIITNGLVRKINPDNALI